MPALLTTTQYGSMTRTSDLIRRSLQPAVVRLSCQGSRMTTRQYWTRRRHSHSTMFLPACSLWVRAILAWSYQQFSHASVPRVTVIELLDSVLPQYDTELTNPVRERAAKLGIDFYFGESASAWTQRDESIVVTTETQNGESTEHEADAVLVSVGRIPVTDGLNLKSIGVPVCLKMVSWRLIGRGRRVVTTFSQSVM